MLLSENTFEGRHTCFKLVRVLVDEMMFTALPTVLVTSWGMHLSMQFLSWQGIIFFPENLDDYEIPLHVINISQESV